MRTLLCALLLMLPALAGEPFYQVSIDEDRMGGAVDFSFLNHPLSPADRLFVRDAHFFTVGKDLKPNTGDDERVRLFGVNMAFGANFPEEADAPRIAKRLRKLGVNVVRLHHMDTSPDSDPGICRSIITTGPYPTLNPLAVARLRKFLDALKAEGIYVNLNLHVGYQFRPGIDDVPAMPEGAAMPTHGKPLQIFFPRMIALQVEFTRKVVEALKLKGDPVLAMVEIDNESSLVEGWQRGQVDRFAVGAYGDELRQQWNAYLKTQGVPLVTAKDLEPKERVNDFLLFLADRDRAYLRELSKTVKDAVGDLVPVTGTQVDFTGLLHLDSHREMDYFDAHFYIDHYDFPHRSWDTRDWRIRDQSAMGTGLGAYLNMAAARGEGKPFTVSEYNNAWPNRQAAEIDPTLAAFAAFQDWDGLMHFAYEHGRTWDKGTPSAFNLNADFGKLPSFGQAAWLFRTGAIEPAPTARTVPVPLDARLQAARGKRVSRLAQSLKETVGYAPEAALRMRVAIAGQEKTAVPDVLKAAPAAPGGPFDYSAEKRVLAINGEKAAGVFGFVGAGGKAAAGAIEVELASSARGFAAILVTALDGKPLSGSKRMLVSTPGYTVGTAPGSEPPRPQKMVAYQGEAGWFTIEPEPESGRPSGANSAAGKPVWMERVESFLTVRSALKGLSVYPLDAAGARLKPLAASDVERVADGFRIHLQGDAQSPAPWYEIEGR